MMAFKGGDPSQAKASGGHDLDKLAFSRIPRECDISSSVRGR